jgi:hypothetical protein
MRLGPLALLLSILCLPAFTGSAAAQADSDQAPPAATWQLLNGDDFLALPEYDRELYVSGLNDAYNWTVPGGFERMRWMVGCVHGRKARQLAAMFAKWLDQNPERWHEPAAKLFPFAMFDLCRSSREGNGEKPR